MKYQEKVKLVDANIAKIDQGTSLAEIKAILQSNDQLYERDIQAIMRSLKNEAVKRYGKKMDPYLLSNTLENNLHHFDFLAKDVIDMVKKEQVTQIIKDSKKKVNKMMYNKIQEAEIITKAENSFFDKTEVQKQIESYKYFNKRVSPRQSLQHIGLGIFFLIVGVIAFATGRIIAGGALIIISITRFVKAFSTQAAIDGMD